MMTPLPGLSCVYMQILIWLPQITASARCMHPTNQPFICGSPVVVIFFFLYFLTVEPMNLRNGYRQSRNSNGSSIRWSRATQAILYSQDFPSFSTFSKYSGKHSMLGISKTFGLNLHLLTDYDHRTWNLRKVYSLNGADRNTQSPFSGGKLFTWRKT